MPRLAFENKITFGTLLQIIALLVGLGGIYGTVTGTMADQARSITALQTVTAGLPSLNTRLTVVESRAETSARRQDEADTRIAAMLDGLQQLTVRAAETGKDVGYLRDWVEEQRRKERISGGVDQ